jgi:hypothetical protein
MNEAPRIDLVFFAPAALACRSDGAPSRDRILDALLGGRSRGLGREE